MSNSKVELMPELSTSVVQKIGKYKLDAYLIALEGWRRGLKLTWYKDETNICKLYRMNGSTQGKFFTLSSKTKTHSFFRSRGDGVSNKSVSICQDKEKTKDLLKKSNVPTPKGSIFKTDSNHVYDYAAEIGYPVIIKPLKGSMGRGVYTNIDSPEELKNSIIDFKKRHKYKEIILEKHYYGNEYRIYVVGDKVVGATNRVPANIEGDGVHTIRELIDNKNAKRKENPYLSPKPIKVDYEIELALKNNSLTIKSILPEGKVLFLREKSNLSSGGDPLEATDELSEDVKKMAVNALKALPSLPHAGVDIIVDPLGGDNSVVLEINATAEISFHVYPWEGKAKDVPGAIIDYYFPETKDMKKSSAYFDYHSTIEPLKTWATESLTIAPAPKEKIYSKKYISEGKVIKVGYMSYIRRQALSQGLNGYVEKTKDNNIEITLIGLNKQVLDDFKNICYKGSKKSKVEKVKELQYEIGKKPFKLGFEVITED